MNAGLSCATLLPVGGQAATEAKYIGKVKNVGKQLPDEALVCRGGTCKAAQFENGAGVKINSEGKLSGVSVNSAPDKSVRELTETIPHSKVGVTTVGEVRKMGGDVVKSPTEFNPFHCLLGGITPEQTEKVFCVQPKPK